MIFIGDRKTIALFAYKNSAGQKKYYTSQGKTLNDSFSFPPLKKYTRISSGYQKSRFHPTLKVWRSHLGTDFAAPKGTPVYASAKGVVKYLATLTGYGNVVYLKHGTKYLTVYAHLAGFKKGLRSGDKVSKGQAIGFVGSTGQSTGHIFIMRFVSMASIKTLRKSNSRSSLLFQAVQWQALKRNQTTYSQN